MLGIFKTCSCNIQALNNDVFMLLRLSNVTGDSNKKEPRDKVSLGMSRTQTSRYPEQKLYASGLCLLFSTGSGRDVPGFGSGRPGFGIAWKNFMQESFGLIFRSPIVTGVRLRMQLQLSNVQGSCVYAVAALKLFRINNAKSSGRMATPKSTQNQLQ